MEKKIELLKQILAIKTVNGRDNEGKAAEFICDYLKQCNIDASIQYIDKKHANVLAEIPGRSRERIIWNGHLDTVPYGSLEEWKTDPAVPVEIDGKVFARGASDMKSGLAAMVYVLGEIGKSGEKPEKTIVFMGTCDEERDGLGARKILEQKYMTDAELLLIGEPTGCRLGIVHKGCIWLQLNVQGVTSHGAYPKAGCNAVEYGFRALGELREWVEGFEHHILGNATAQITMVKGGIAPNMTPDTAEFLMDIRVVPGLSSREVIQKMEKICEKLYRCSGLKVGFHMKLQNDRRAIEISPENEWVLHIRNCLEASGREPEEIGINYFTDASILTRGREEMPVLLFGPGEPHAAHKPNEYVELKNYLEYIELLQQIFS